MPDDKRICATINGEVNAQILWKLQEIMYLLPSLSKLDKCAKLGIATNGARRES